MGGTNPVVRVLQLVLLVSADCFFWPRVHTSCIWLGIRILLGRSDGRRQKFGLVVGQTEHDSSPPRLHLHQRQHCSHRCVLGLGAFRKRHIPCWFQGQHVI